MEHVFLTVLNLSIKASWMIPAVLILRYLFRNTSKKYRILLWGLTGIRLILPFSFESIFSLLPSKQTVPADISLMPVPAIDSGIEVIDQSINPVLADSFTPAVSDSANPLQVWNYIIAWIWLIGVCAMLGYMIISAYRLKRKVSRAAKTEEGIYEDSVIPSPFVFGMFRPYICLPAGINEPQRSDILRHERMHIRRKDTLIKPVAFMILSLHWFNPLVWLSWHLLCRDIELACDEAVLDELDEKGKKQYAKTILDSAYGKTGFAISPVSFQETSTKERITNMIRYRKPGVIMAVFALIICALTGCAFLSDPETPKENTPAEEENPPASKEVLELQIDPAAADQTVMIRRTDNEDMIQQFKDLYEDMLKAKDETGLVSLKYGYENINDGRLVLDDMYIHFMKDDLAVEMQDEAFREAYYVQLYDDQKEKKLLNIAIIHPFAKRLEDLIMTMKELPYEQPSADQILEPVAEGITLIRTGAKDIWCLKDEQLLRADHFSYPGFTETEVQNVLAECGYPVCDVRDGAPAGSVFDSFTFENYDGPVSRRAGRYLLIQMNEEQAYDLAAKLENSQVSFSVQDNDTGVIMEIPVNVLTGMIEDPSFGADQIPLLRNLLTSQYFIQTGNDEGVLMSPLVQDDALYFDLQFASDGRSAAEGTVKIIPDDPDVFDSLNRVFKGTAENSSEYNNSGEMYFLPYTQFRIKPGRYAVEVRSSSICFYSLDENDQIIVDSGMEFPVYIP